MSSTSTTSTTSTTATATATATATETATCTTTTESSCLDSERCDSVAVGTDLAAGHNETDNRSRRRSHRRGCFGRVPRPRQHLPPLLHGARGTQRPLSSSSPSCRFDALRQRFAPPPLLPPSSLSSSSSLSLSSTEPPTCAMSSSSSSSSSSPSSSLPPEDPSQHVVVKDNVLVASLRECGGLLNEATKLVVRSYGGGSAMKPILHPEDDLLRAVTARARFLPVEMARVALVENYCDVDATLKWIVGRNDGDENDDDDGDGDGDGDGDIGRFGRGERGDIANQEIGTERGGDGETAGPGAAASESNLERCFRIASASVLASPSSSSSSSSDAPTVAPAVPEGIANLVSRWSRPFAPLDSDGRLADLCDSGDGHGKSPIALDGHWMVPCSEPIKSSLDDCVAAVAETTVGIEPTATTQSGGGGGGDDDHHHRCALCSYRIPGDLTGRRRCVHCSLCEGCVRSGVVYGSFSPSDSSSTSASASASSVSSCPGLLNGGHLHVHPLVYDASSTHCSSVQRIYSSVQIRSRAWCDVGGVGCASRRPRTDAERRRRRTIVTSIEGDEDGEIVEERDLGDDYDDEDDDNGNDSDDGGDRRNSNSRCGATWMCTTCDFDVCHVCIRRPAPEGYDRRAGRRIVAVAVKKDGGGGGGGGGDNGARGQREQASGARLGADVVPSVDGCGVASATTMTTTAAALAEANSESVIQSMQQRLRLRLRMERRSGGGGVVPIGVHAVAARPSPAVASLRSSPFDPCAIESDLAKDWEGGASACATNNVADVVVGTGRVGRTFDVTVQTSLASSFGSGRAAARRSLTTATMAAESCVHFPSVSILPDAAKAALDNFRLQGLNSTDGRSTATTATVAISTTTTMGAPTRNGTPASHLPTATDAALAEIVLHNAQAEDVRRVRDRIYLALSNGDVGLACLLLATQRYAPCASSLLFSKSKGTVPAIGGASSVAKAAAAKSSPAAVSASDEDDAAMCWCGEQIDLDSCPYGAIGCVQGHAMHPNCAADLLLGGGSCPVCREPIYLGKLSGSEVKESVRLMKMTKTAAAEAGSEEGRDRMKVDATVVGGCPGREGSVLGGREKSYGGYHGIGPFRCGDLVKICSDVALCERTQCQDAFSGGWHTVDMADICGSVGTVVDLVRDATKTTNRIVAIRVMLWKRNRVPRASRTRRVRRGVMCHGCTRAISSGGVCIYCARCETCCGGSATTATTWPPPPSLLNRQGVCDLLCHEWVLHSSLVELVERAEDEEDDPFDQEDGGGGGRHGTTDMAAAERLAERHVFRLHYELAAAKAAREALRDKLEEAACSDCPYGGGGASAPLLSDASLSSLKEGVVGKVSRADCERAYHLLRLAEEWVADRSAADVSSTSSSTNCDADLVRAYVRGCNIEAAARFVRRHNAAREMEAAAWADAFNRKREYTVKQAAHLCLLAFPDAHAPKTGFVLTPRSIFRGEDEFVDDDGNLWIRVAPRAENYIDVLLDGGVGGSGGVSASNAFHVLMGCKVRRGRDWRHGDQDGGDGNEGVVVRARPGGVFVRWRGLSSIFRYRFGGGPRGARRYMEVEVIAPSPPPQGWLCANAKGSTGFNEGTLLVEPAFGWGALKCSCCNGALSVSARAQKCRGSIYTTANADTVSSGDSLLVAATLERVRVEEVKDGRIYCSFVSNDGNTSSGEVGERSRDTSVTASAHGQDARNVAKRARHGEGSFVLHSPVRAIPIWYRSEDLVYPAAPQEKTMDYLEEKRTIDGRARSRRELVLLHPDDEEGAKAAWDKAARGGTSNEHDSLKFASCLRGHFFHARCFMKTLISGGCCPASGCSEPLWVPAVSRTDGEDCSTSCGGAVTDRRFAVSQGLGMAGVTSSSPPPMTTYYKEDSEPRLEDRADKRSSAEEEATIPSGSNYRMCPACCAGPFQNESCSDMASHHGQCMAMALGGRHHSESTASNCTPSGSFRVSASEIAARLAQLQSTGGTKAVVDVLPRCPTHDVPVMFNGCLSCGHLFTSTGWNDLPSWDPNAKQKLALDRTKIATARLLASQVRAEAAALQFERHVLENLRLRHGAMALD